MCQRQSGEKLFDLIRKAVNLPGMTADEKEAAIYAAADENDCVTEAEEFAAYLYAD